MNIHTSNKQLSVISFPEIYPSFYSYHFSDFQTVLNVFKNAMTQDIADIWFFLFSAYFVERYDDIPCNSGSSKDDARRLKVFLILGRML